MTNECITIWVLKHCENKSVDETNDLINRLVINLCDLRDYKRCINDANDSIYRVK